MVQQFLQGDEIQNRINEYHYHRIIVLLLSQRGNSFDIRKVWDTVMVYDISTSSWIIVLAKPRQAWKENLNMEAWEQGCASKIKSLPPSWWPKMNNLASSCKMLLSANCAKLEAQKYRTPGYIQQWWVTHQPWWRDVRAQWIFSMPAKMAPFLVSVLSKSGVTGKDLSTMQVCSWLFRSSFTVTDCGW